MAFCKGIGPISRSPHRLSRGRERYSYIRPSKISPYLLVYSPHLLLFDMAANPAIIHSAIAHMEPAIQVADRSSASRRSSCPQT